MAYLNELVSRQKSGEAIGICSVCSSSPFVIDAAMLHAKAHDTYLLLEATANQVNQFGGYTGHTPASFADSVTARAQALGLPSERLILGGDHLGPVAWKKAPAVEAMDKAAALVEAFAAAGYAKLHLDASMPLGDEKTLSVSTVAMRAAELLKVAERAYSAYRDENPKAPEPVYVIGSEVPTPGGSGDESALSVTEPKALLNMLDVFEQTFKKAGLQSAWERVIAAVVQPGVEFGNDSVHEYEPELALELTAAAKRLKNIVLEGHSTDYQTETSLRRLVTDGVAILKVGPALTFACREALFALCCMERELKVAEPSGFMEILEAVMLEKPDNWAGHYRAEGSEARLLRRFSYSDRSRYYMSEPRVEAAVEKLLCNLKELPLPLISQFLPQQYLHIREGRLTAQPRALVLDKIDGVLEQYSRACGII